MRLSGSVYRPPLHFIGPGECLSEGNRQRCMVAAKRKEKKGVCKRTGWLPSSSSDAGPPPHRLTHHQQQTHHFCKVGRHTCTLASPPGPDPVFPSPYCVGGGVWLAPPWLTAVHFGPQSLIQQYRDVSTCCTATSGGCSAWHAAGCFGSFLPAHPSLAATVGTVYILLSVWCSGQIGMCMLKGEEGKQGQVSTSTDSTVLGLRLGEGDAAVPLCLCVCGWQGQGEEVLSAAAAVERGKRRRKK